ncbi:hypothetical protein TRVA0_079S00232 [Trichomonascus vanleenenianus]|uniref:uncharacterized protein n=1 Tax=Trichomonascus vanleenenianus TaxID=2268995 RepID=UPI003ECB7DBE
MSFGPGGMPRSRQQQEFDEMLTMAPEAPMVASQNYERSATMMSSRSGRTSAGGGRTNTMTSFSRRVSASSSKSNLFSNWGRKRKEADDTDFMGDDEIYDDGYGAPSGPGGGGKKLNDIPGVAMNDLSSIRDRDRYPTMAGQEPKIGDGRAMSITSMSGGFDTTPIIPTFAAEGSGKQYRKNLVNTRKHALRTSDGVSYPPIMQNGMPHAMPPGPPQGPPLQNNRFRGPGPGSPPGRSNSGMGQYPPIMMDQRPPPRERAMTMGSGPRPPNNIPGYDGIRSPPLGNYPPAQMQPRGQRMSAGRPPMMMNEMMIPEHPRMPMVSTGIMTEALEENDTPKQEPRKPQMVDNSTMVDNPVIEPVELEPRPEMVDNSTMVDSPVPETVEHITEMMSNSTMVESPEMVSSSTMVETRQMVNSSTMVEAPQKNEDRHIDLGPATISDTTITPITTNDIATLPQLPTGFAPVSQEVAHMNKSLLNEIRLVTTELADAIRRELRVDEMDSASSSSTTTSPDDNNNEHAARALQIVQLQNELDAERRKRLIAESYLQKDPQMIKLLNGTYDKLELETKLTEKDRLLQNEKLETAMLNENLAALNAQYEALQEETNQLKNGILPELKSHVQDLEVLTAAGNPIELLKQIEELKVENKKMQKLVEENSTRGPIGEKIKEVQSQRDALREALRSLRERKDHEIRQSTDRVRHLESRLEKEKLVVHQLQRKIVQTSFAAAVVRSASSPVNGTFLGKHHATSSTSTIGSSASVDVNPNTLPPPASGSIYKHRGMGSFSGSTPALHSQTLTVDSAYNHQSISRPNSPSPVSFEISQEPAWLDYVDASKLPSKYQRESNNHASSASLSLPNGRSEVLPLSLGSAGL